MKPAIVSEAIALRIGLAARELPDIELPQLWAVIAETVGLPPTTEALEQLTIKQLMSAADGLLSTLDGAALQAALAHLKGEGEMRLPAEPLPTIDPDPAGDMPESIRVACASDHGDLLDGHFGSCRRFLIYQLSATQIRLIAIRDIDSAAAAASADRNHYRAALISDCQLLFVASIGGPAAAKVIRAGIHPIKQPQGGSARTALAALQPRIGSGAPPWLAKVMGEPPEQRIRFSRSEEIGA